MNLEEDFVDIVAVSANPVLYNIDCSICDDLIAEDTEDGDSLEPIAEAHRRSHASTLIKSQRESDHMSYDQERGFVNKEFHVQGIGKSARFIFNTREEAESYAKSESRKQRRKYLITEVYEGEPIPEPIVEKKPYTASNTVLVHSDEYSNWIFDQNHPTQGRRFINARNQFAALMDEKGKAFTEVKPRLATRAELERVHDARYVDQVLRDHECGEWEGKRPDLSHLAALFAGGTLVALDALLNKGARTAIHFPGAKHHAQYDHSSGFCVFNDFALAAEIATKDYGLYVAILDIDAHHGDGVENLTADNPKVLTYSIHDPTIFPGTGLESIPEKGVFNFPLYPYDYNKAIAGKGDEGLGKAVSDALLKFDYFDPDLIFITCGADGLLEDPLSSLQYSVEGYADMARFIRRFYPDVPILMGGAGGYLPDTGTPEVWSHFAKDLALTRSFPEDFPRS